MRALSFKTEADLQAHVDVELSRAAHILQCYTAPHLALRDADLIALEAPDDNCAEERVEEEEEEDGGEPELAVHDMRSVRVRLAHGNQTQVGEVEQKDYGHWHEGVELKHLHVPTSVHLSLRPHLAGTETWALICDTNSSAAYCRSLSPHLAGTDHGAIMQDTTRRLSQYKTPLCR
eukprot:1485035-Rhodomonas_salina.2